MGLLDELIVLVKETIEEANERNRPRPGMPDGEEPHEEPRNQPPQRSAEEVEALRRSLARRAAEMRMA
jgi:hypothetical protein